MKDENNIKALDELNKGCCMGSDAVKVIEEKIEGKEFRKVIKNLLEQYEDLQEKINKVYDEYSDDAPQETNIMNKAMTWYGIQMRTIADDSESKLAEMLLQGLNMGVIEGRKLLNHKTVDNDISSLIKEYVDMQEKYVEKMKEFL